MTEAVAEDEGKAVKQHTLKIMESHMPKSKEDAAVKIVKAAVDNNTQLMDIAHQIKTQYDKQYPGSGKATEGVYHAICGHHFASMLRSMDPSGQHDETCQISKVPPVQHASAMKLGSTVI
jgi:hypothetical protein